MKNSNLIKLEIARSLKKMVEDQPLEVYLLEHDFGSWNGTTLMPYLNVQEPQVLLSGNKD